METAALKSRPFLATIDSLAAFGTQSPWCAGALVRAQHSGCKRPDHNIGAQRVLEHEPGKNFSSIGLLGYPGYGLHFHEMEPPFSSATKAISLP